MLFRDLGEVFACFDDMHGSVAGLAGRRFSQTNAGSERGSERNLNLLAWPKGGRIQTGIGLGNVGDPHVVRFGDLGQIIASDNRVFCCFRWRFARRWRSGRSDDDRRRNVSRLSDQFVRCGKVRRHGRHFLDIRVISLVKLWQFVGRIIGRLSSLASGSVGVSLAAALHEQAGKEDAVNGDNRKDSDSNGGFAFRQVLLKRTLRHERIWGVHEMMRWLSVSR